MTIALLYYPVFYLADFVGTLGVFLYKNGMLNFKQQSISVANLIV
jgi:hypothetical protein